ncbi:MULTISPECIES: ShlB/FhaC/HecB family hemolysin secretion/activation protein [unclassified Yoonia]|uniref:ShlB/FhaC/HecB family hemolysin secretion/activation protein n=1 Tax=unclassified Yoonia TaxID=2629118 RepID=UPI002AFED9F4|nr:MULTISPECIES: ShlB/FhaC/HecB family hemolysin secretion/activation protein [unclassified Yoonia]
MRALAILIAGLAGPAGAQGFCVPIDRIDVTGATLVTQSQIEDAVREFEGYCLGMEQINAALEAVTFLYVDRGYITARAYLPEQNIADRSLDIRVVEGELAAIRFNGQERRIWQQIAFPGLTGRTANLREIEQGLDIIRGMPSFEATMEITAGEAEGQSILDVSAAADKRWTARIGANNFGTPEKGEYNGFADLTYDHLLGLNETWSLNLSRGAEGNPFTRDTGGAATENASLGLRLPYGPWALQGTYRYSYYETDTLGPITSIGTDGWTNIADLSLSRVLHRNQDSKTSVRGVVTWRDNVNRIAEIQINASSRTLASARIDLDHERGLWGGGLSARIGYEQGLDAFGAEVAADPLVGPNPQFTLADFELRYGRGWPRESGNIGFSTTLRGQWSDDALYGAYQFGIGGQSSVRGVKVWNSASIPDPDGDGPLKETPSRNLGLFTGNTGLVWRNDVSWSPNVTLPATFGALQTYAGLDAGIVDFDRDGASKALTGAAIGVRTTGGTVSVDLAWHRLLSIYEETDPGPTLSPVLDPKGVILLSVTATF